MEASEVDEMDYDSIRAKPLRGTGSFMFFLSPDMQKIGYMAYFLDRLKYICSKKGSWITETLQYSTGPHGPRFLNAYLIWGATGMHNWSKFSGLMPPSMPIEQKFHQPFFFLCISNGIQYFSVNDY